ncbi:hypothetical protein KIPB_012296, partial [Kipferlia bialata]
LLTTLQGDLQDLAEEYTMAVETLEQEYEMEREAQMAQHARAVQIQEEILSALSQEASMTEGEIRKRYQTQIDELKNRNQEALNIMRLTLEDKIDELERHFMRAHQAYFSSTESRTHHFKV